MKRRSWKIVILAIATMLFSAFGLVACGEVENTETEHVHEWADWTVTEKATCEEAGLQYRFCYTCDEEEVQEILPLGHRLAGGGRVLKEPTCTEKGQRVGFCEGRGCSYYINETIPELGHAMGETVTSIAPTCTEEGLAVCSCERENCEYYEEEVLLALEHKLGEAVTVKVATCLEDGRKVETCERENCEYFEEEILSALGHDMGEMIPVQKPTCVADGKKVSVCGREGCAHFVEEALPMLGHAMGEPVYNENATCTQNGTQTSFCEREGCEETLTTEVAGTQLEHSYLYENAESDYLAVAQNCTDGAKYYKSCVCGKPTCGHLWQV